MQFATAVGVESGLLALALVFVVARCYVHLYINRQGLSIADYILIIGWLAPLLKVLCNGMVFSWGLDSDNDHSVEIMKVNYVATILLEVGLYFPKASLLAFYWHLIPYCYSGVRKWLYAITGYIAAAMLITTCLDLFYCIPVSSNWSEDPDACSVYNSWEVFGTNWALNITTDLAVFLLPFFLVRHLKLQKRARYCVIAIFSIGAISMLTSIARFTYYTRVTTEDASGDVWCTGEMCTAVIVVSLPALKPFLSRARGTGTTTKGLSTSATESALMQATLDKSDGTDTGTGLEMAAAVDWDKIKFSTIAPAKRVNNMGDQHCRISILRPGPIRSGLES